MADKETGGLAFPFNDIGGDCYPGMTLRDYFAAKAMAALISRYDSVNIDKEGVAEEIANSANKLADAMLAARSK
ncbi:hypothetical protein [Yersinia vastinensis]|uniref:hypothetical protein n=1 Tax=Yersinia vastinensis TaxID=2890318 RepID=UPI00384EF949